MPRLIDFYERHSAERDRFEILAFHDGTAKTFEDLDKKTKEVQEKVWKKPLPFPVLLDASGGTTKRWGVHAFPTTVLIDPDGKLVRGGGERMLEQKLKEAKK